MENESSSEGLTHSGSNASGCEGARHCLFVPRALRRSPLFLVRLADEAKPQSPPPHAVTDAFTSSIGMRREGLRVALINAARGASLSDPTC